MLGKIVVEFCILLGTILDFIKSNFYFALVSPTNEFLVVNADEIVGSNFIDKDPVKLVFPQQIMLPGVPLVFRKRLEPTVGFSSITTPP